jgi:ribonuclease P protein component
MLPAANRLRASADFVTVLRSGQRTGRPNFVLHYAARATPDVSSDPTGVGGDKSVAGPARFGLVVGKSVGNSVTRHQVSRRLRAQLSQRIARFPLGIDVVVRARPDSASADSAEIGRDLDRVLNRLFVGGSSRPSSASVRPARGRHS